MIQRKVILVDGDGVPKEQPCQGTLDLAGPLADGELNCRTGMGEARCQGKS